MTERASRRTATIASGASLSAAIDLAGDCLAHFHVPASFEGGYLQFEIAPDADGTYATLKDKDGNNIRYKADSSTCVRVDLIDFIGVQHLKLRSTDNAGASVNQSGGDAAIVLVSVP